MSYADNNKELNFEHPKVELRGNEKHITKKNQNQFNQTPINDNGPSQCTRTADKEWSTKHAAVQRELSNKAFDKQIENANKEVWEE